MLKNPNTVNLGYAEPYRNFLYIDDMLDAWDIVISNYDKCNDGKIFTMGPDCPIKIKDYANLIAGKLGWTGKITWHTKLERPGEIFWLNSNCNLIQKTLGWSPKMSLSDGLDKTIAIWKDILKQ
jgi:nucleoside-diphosphate-sugar epimerase